MTPKSKSVEDMSYKERLAMDLFSLEKRKL